MEVGKNNRNTTATVNAGDAFLNCQVCLPTLCWILGISDGKYRQFVHSDLQIDRRRKIIDDDGVEYSGTFNVIF